MWYALFKSDGWTRSLPTFSVTDAYSVLENMARVYSAAPLGILGPDGEVIPIETLDHWDMLEEALAA